MKHLLLIGFAFLALNAFVFITLTLPFASNMTDGFDLTGTGVTTINRTDSIVAYAFSDVA